MHQRVIQLFLLLLFVAIGVTVTVYALQSGRSELALTNENALPTATNALQSSGIVTATLSNSRQAGNNFVEAVSIDADNFNPIYTTNPTSLSVLDKIYPALVGQDRFTGAYTPSDLAENWQFADSGATITFTLYAGLQWSDGEPIRAADVAFTYDLIQNTVVASPYRQNFAKIETIEARDDRTLVLQLTTADCSIFQSLRHPILPAHLYNGELLTFQQSDPNQLPTLGAGPFLFESRSNNRILLRRNPLYRLGAPLLETYEFQIIPDEAEQLTGLTDGNLDLLHLSTAQLETVVSSTALALYKSALDSITFLALNLANPQNPQPGRAGDGSLLPQEPHPILGTLPVRQALAYALDYDQLLHDGFHGQAMRTRSYLPPTITWAHNTQLPPYTYDLAAARQLLDAAGWLDGDNDGIRERDSVPMQLTLLTNQDSALRLRLSELIRQQAAEMGIDIRIEALPFETLTAELLGQRYDLVLIGWDTLGAEPSNSDFWLSHQDLPRSFDTNGIGGANFTSYQNVAVDLWLSEARSAPTCDGGYRSLRYRQVQERIHADLPYIVLGIPLQGWAYSTAWSGILPQPWYFGHNIHRWQFGQP